MELKYYTIFIAFLSANGGFCQEMETVTGTIYCDNEFILYVNGEQIAYDDYPILQGHNALNVSFTVPKGKNYVIAIEGIDWADNETGLEFDGRCIGSGGLRAMFSNGVVTNSSWVCKTHNYGPVNWKRCFGGQMVRNQSLQLHLACIEDSTPPLVGCMSRTTPKPQGWNKLNFNVSHWEYALEYSASDVGYGLPPPGCSVPGTYVSSDNTTCPANLDWGEAKFIWRPDRDLDNTILCRYVVEQETSGVEPSGKHFVCIATVLATFALQVFGML